MKKQLTPHSLLKIAQVILGIFLLAFIGIISTLHAVDSDPTPSKSIGSDTVVINNQSKYNIEVSFSAWNPNHSRGHNDFSKLVLANKPETFGPLRGCNAGLAGTWTNFCFWGANREKEGINSGELKVKSQDFPDRNAEYTIKIFQNNGKGKFPLESMTDRNKAGYCTYRMLEWTAEWKDNHYEVTFKGTEGDTNRPRSTCIK